MIEATLMTPCFWPEVRRGGERIVRDLADGLREQGHAARIVTAHPGRPGRAVEDGVEVVRHWRPPDGRLLRRGYEDHLSAAAFALLSARRGDVAHAFHPAWAWAAVRSGRPAVLTHLGIPARASAVSRRGRLRLLTEAVARCAGLTALSEFAAASARRDLGGDWRAIPPAVDLDRFSPRPDERADIPTAVCLADPAEPRKRVALLAQAWPLVRASRPGARLVLLRGGPTGDGIEHVEPLADPAPLYRRAWCSVLPSRAEAFGMVLAEALACGTPVVGTDEGGIPEVLDGRDEAGVLMTPDGGPRELARAILSAFERPGGEACRAVVAPRLSRDAVTLRYVQLYDEVLGRA